MIEMYVSVYLSQSQYRYFNFILHILKNCRYPFPPQNFKNVVKKVKKKREELQNSGSAPTRKANL